MILPVEAVLPDLCAALQRGSSAVLVAPPGAGKTTLVAPALIDQDWCLGQILLLSPRRLAARAAAERMAELAGEPVGQSIGYATRMDSRISSKTRIIVLTEGIFRNRIQADPELDGVSAVLFDEVHERSLDSDFGLALALDAQAGFRPDLRIVAMSATLDGQRFAGLMNAPVFESEGRAHPLALRHIGRRTEARIEDEMAAVIKRALSDEAEGDILAFLPGVAEIGRAAERLEGIGAEVHQLHGSLDPAQQRRAIIRGRTRKVILATSIAETSLTIDGVRIVVDSGLARRPRYDRQTGSTRLVTERASQAAVTQRAGRAARQAPGVVYRLWEESATAGLPPFDPPEILESDLAPLLLDCLIWGVGDPADLNWIDSPPAAALAEARNRLVAIEAVDGDGRPTGHGKAVAALPMPLSLGHMLVRAGDAGWAALAAEVAVLLSERGLGGQDTDLETRLDRWRRDGGKRAESARRLAQRWSGLVRNQGQGEGRMAEAIAIAFPDRLARRRDAAGENWISVGGRGFRLDSASSLAKAEWLAVADIQGAASGARILSAAAIDFVTIERLFGDQMTKGVSARYDLTTGGVIVESGTRLGAISIGHSRNAMPPEGAVDAALLDAVKSHGLNLITWPDRCVALRQRAIWAGLEALSDTALLGSLDEWFAPLLPGKRRFGEIGADQLYAALLGGLDWPSQQALDRDAPPHFTSPAGTTHQIDYAAEAGPTVELRVQALFGLAAHPTIGGGRTPLILSLTSPAGRPIQTTRDLPGFWAGSWADVAKEMRGRYPRHNWPDDPKAAVASLKTKKALDRQG